MTYPQAPSAQERCQMLWSLWNGHVYDHDLHNKIIKLCVESAIDARDDRIAEIAMAVQNLHEYIPGRTLTNEQAIRRDAIFEASRMIFERFLKAGPTETKRDQGEFDRRVRALVREEIALDRQLRSPHSGGIFP